MVHIGQIPCFRHFVWVRQPKDADCVISIEYYSDLLNHASKNVKSWSGENIPIIIKIEKPKLSVYFHRARTPHFLTRDLLTLNHTLSMLHGPRPLTAGPIRNAENMEYLASVEHNLGRF